MCHGAAVDAFPAPYVGEIYDGAVQAYMYGDDSAQKKIAILPDIFGCNPFYQGLALHYVEAGAKVFLIDPFVGLGELEENTVEAAFGRRQNVKDKSFLDGVEAFAKQEGITGIIGFCLGGMYIFDLARRNIDAALVGLYGFPQGMDNIDPIEPPFNYLTSLTQPFTMLMGRQDPSVGVETVDKLSAMAPECPAMDLTVYPDSDHGFLPDISSDDPTKRAVAEDALKRLDAAVL